MVSQLDIRPCIIAAALAVTSSLAQATDIGGGTNPYNVTLLYGAVDQPKINMQLKRTLDGAPLLPIDPDDPLLNTPVINAFLDTGASAHLLSNETAGMPSELNDPDDPAPGLGIVRQKVGGIFATFEDAGGGGDTVFHISEPLFMELAPHTLQSAFSIPGDPDFRPAPSDFKPFPTAPVTQTFQIGAVPRPSEGDPLRNLDVVGMPAMKNKVVVMDSRGLNTYADGDIFDLENIDVMHTFIYEPGTPFNASDAALGQLSADPGIPSVDNRIKLSYANFADFSTTSPGAATPSFTANPFIGKDPVRTLDGVAQENVPGIKLSHDGASVPQASFLLDTGAGASFIAEHIASQLGVFYDPLRRPGDPIGTTPADPLLVDANGDPIPDQFKLSIAAFGGDNPLDPDDSSSITISGFFIDSMLVRTMEGDAANDLDPEHLNYFQVPVLVFDIKTSRMNLDTSELETIVLDGIFGMNLLTASAIPGEDIFDIPLTTSGAFDWLVYNDPEGWLGVTFEGSAIPEPASLSLLAFGAGFVLRRRRSL